MTDLAAEIGLQRIPEHWDRRYSKNLDQLSQPRYGVREERDVWMTLRDGTRLCVDIFRPDVDDEQHPALLAWAAYGKSIQSMHRGTIPSASLLFDHSLEAGDIEFFVSRGYIYVIPDPRGIGKSEGEFLGVYNPQEQLDTYDMIEWMAELPYCDGNVAMSGYSYFGIIQMLTAALQPPHLRCIMPLSFTDDYYQHGYYGGVPSTYMSIYWELSPANNPVAYSTKLYDEQELKKRIAERLADPDIAINSYLVKILTTWPPTYHTFFLDYLLHPLDGDYWKARSANQIYDRVKVPVYLKCGWSPSMRWSAPAFAAFNDERLDVTKRVSVMEGYGGLELPYRYMNEECLRWYDHWLKGVDTGMLGEPPIKLNIIGAGFRYEHEWPLARTRWRKLYLRSFGNLRWDPDPEGDIPPDSFTHRPPNITADVERVVYRTEPLARPIEFTGPMELHLFLSIDTTDADIIAKVWNVMPGGQRLPVSRWGALRLSHPLDEEASSIGRPVHDNTREEPVTPGQVNEYVLEMNPIGMVFLPGSRIELELSAMDPTPGQENTWTGKVGSMGPMPRAKTINYRIYRDRDHQSYLLMPQIPETPRENWITPIE